MFYPFPFKTNSQQKKNWKTHWTSTH